MVNHPDLHDVARTMTTRVARLAHQLCRHDAADAQQEVFRELTRSWPNFRGDAAPTTWAHRLAIRTLIRFAERQRRQRAFEPNATEMRLDLDERALASFADNPLARLVADERRARVHAALDTLSPPLRDVLVLRVGEGLDYAAIAAALELPLGTVKSRIAAATLRLAERLHDLKEQP